LIDLISVAEQTLDRVGYDFTRLSLIQMKRSASIGVAASALVFVDGGKEPVVYLKVTDDSAKTTLLKREFSTLSSLWEHGSEEFKKSVPQPLYFGEVGSLTVLAETVKPGTRMKNLSPNSYFKSKSFRMDFEQAADWLCQFQQCLEGHEPVDSLDDIDSQLTVPIEKFRRSYSVSSKVESMLEATQESLSKVNTPLFFWHGDYCTANILVTETRSFSVIDREYPLERSWPLNDLIYFISSVWCIPYVADADGLQSNYRKLFFSSNRHSELIKSTVSRYLAEFGIGIDMALPLSVIAWVWYANRRRLEMELLSCCCSHKTKSMPLIMIEDDYCLNLEFLAELQETYVLR